MDDNTLLETVQALARGAASEDARDPSEDGRKRRAFAQAFFPGIPPEVRLCRLLSGEIRAQILHLGGTWTHIPDIGDPDPRLIAARASRSGTVVLRHGALLAIPVPGAPTLRHVTQRFPRPGEIGTFDLLLPELPTSAHARLALQKETMQTLAQELGLRPGTARAHAKLDTPWIQASMPNLRVVIALNDTLLSQPYVGRFAPASLAMSPL